MSLDATASFTVRYRLKRTEVEHFSWWDHLWQRSGIVDSWENSDKPEREVWISSEEQRSRTHTFLRTLCFFWKALSAIRSIRDKFCMVAQRGFSRVP